MTHRFSTGDTISAGVPDWALPLLRCPWCMSALALATGSDVPALRCGGCERAYPLVPRGGDDGLMPRLTRGGALAVPERGTVTRGGAPETARSGSRGRASHHERRERFLRSIVRDVDGPDACVGLDAAPRFAEPVSAEMAAFDRFAELLPARPTVLDLSGGATGRPERLAAGEARVLVRRRPRPAGVGPDACSFASEPGAAVASPLQEHAPGDAGPTAFVETVLLEMPFATEALDGAWCGAAFARIRPDRRTVFFRHAHRILRPGGLLCAGAETKPWATVAYRFLLWRFILRRPVVPGEYIDRPTDSAGGGRLYRAMTTARELRALCRDHGFRVLLLRREGSLLALLARKVG